MKVGLDVRIPFNRDLSTGGGEKLHRKRLISPPPPLPKKAFPEKNFHAISNVDLI